MDGKFSHFLGLCCTFSLLKISATRYSRLLTTFYLEVHYILRLRLVTLFHLNIDVMLLLGRRERLNIEV